MAEELEKERLEEKTEETEVLETSEIEEVEIEEIETVEPEEDYQDDTIAIRKKLRKRVTTGTALITIFLLFRRIDAFKAFNPISSLAFTLITIVILVYCMLVLFVDYVTNENEYYKKDVYTRYKTMNGIYDYFSIVPYIMVILTIVNMFFFSFSPISGSSMEPNFSDDEAVVFSHLVDEYDRFDVVIVYVEEFSDPYLIKRVIALPGETVTIDHNEIFIEDNGVQTKLDQTFIDTETVKTVCYASADRDVCSWTLSEDEYFVLGDNRDGNGLSNSSSGYSLDSRKFGQVEATDIYGKVVLKFKDFNILK